MKKYVQDEIIYATITAIEPYGAFVKIDDDYTGLIHISEINGKFIKNINNYFKKGNIVKAKVIGVDNKKKQLKLTMIDINAKKGNKNILEETNLGFSILEEKLPEWVDEKKKEIEKCKK